MPILTKKNFLFKFHFFRIYIYHPLLLLLNFLRYPKLSFKLVESILKSNSFNVYGFKIQSPKKIDRFFISNINAKFNYFILEKYEQNEKYLVEKYIDENDKVLELGGCLGVISLIINNKLLNKNYHLVLEIDSEKYKFLNINKQLNNSGYISINGAFSENEKVFYDKSLFWGGKLSQNKNDIPVESYNLVESEKIIKAKFNALVMDIEGGEVEVINSLNFNNFDKVIFEIHFDRGSYEYQEISKKLKSNKFKRIETKDRVEIWKK